MVQTLSFSLQIKWNDDLNRFEYLENFQRDFYAVIKRQIDYHMAQTQPKDSLYNEILEHSIQCQMLNERYFPRNDILTMV